ncbi:MAG: hypothetical protein QOJ76_2216 [Acidobacteriota bacterium]|jgi:hypothetical protein|nr:hypothetical protein [Acidobacteriota bacterium]
MRKLFAIVFIVAGLVVCAVSLTALSLKRRQEPGARQTVKERKTATSSGGDSKRAPVVVELFTSEGCSSCPPADALLARLDKTQPVDGAEVIPLAMHVDYWNYLGWADPFSSHEFSERQGEYARAYGKEGVYTPQMIVDGVKEFPGGNSPDALDAIGKAARAPKADVQFARAAAETEAGVRLSVRIENLPKLTEGDDAYVLLALTESGLSSDVARGENSGRRLSHAGVVRRLTTLGSLADARGGTFSTEAMVTIEKGWRRENLRAVVFAQERGSRRVIAAASLKLFG